MTGPDPLAIVAIAMSGITLVWQSILTIRLNDAHFDIAPAPVLIQQADGRPPVSLTLTSRGANLVKDVRLEIHGDPMNQSLQLSDRRWHSIPAGGSVRTTAYGIGWYHPSGLPMNPWNQRFHADGQAEAERLATVTWTNALGIRRKQTLELPLLPHEPEWATEEMGKAASQLRALHS